MKPEVRKKKQKDFLEAFAECVTIREACRIAGIARSTVFEWQEHDEEFSLLYNQAKADADDVIRAEIKRRAIDGVDEYVTSMGKVVYFHDQPLTITKYSDSLLSLLAKARMPEFREKTHIDVDANVSGNLKTPDLSQELRILTGPQLAQLKSWLLEAKAKQE